MTKISIIIPVLNEAKNIGSLLNYLIVNSSGLNVPEIIVVDGGSTDGSQKIVSSFKLVKLMSSEKGRAKQMNVGAKASSGDILYFLHADSIPPKNFDTLIIDEVKKGNKAGCFRMQFDCNHWWLNLASWLTQFKWRACRGGDQSQFITKALFDDIGGYDENYNIYEDNILINELYKRNQFVVINKKLKTSARLYKKHGIWKIQYHYWTIYVKCWFGANSDDIYQYYKKHLS
ncbi:MAG: glycosyltransferase [Winogradskyella sp.]|uniref:TIGR04283 family arsenosugar biosynthesis glycosyltransferase n=1 Tax=Winogradskyella sp. TaxID=1883156 RepID=UPI000F3FEE96|nr:TIGR04283 family arsenosugar biosynthesis glycosyltransferase [Winogradskyella sp.]RNC84153.1 MAG: glycosyltransferase [Winogradskyella sp.]